MSKAHEGNLDHCLKCSTCHTQCPVVANYLKYPGPKYLGPELERLRLARGEREPLKIDDSLAYCTNCKRCDIACPHGVKPSFYNLKNKARVKARPSERLRDWILAHNVWWGKMASKVPGLSNFVLKHPVAKYAMGTMGIAPRDFPEYKKQKLKINNQQTQVTKQSPKDQEGKKVLYYPGCYASFNEPEIIQAAIDILERHGYDVQIAPTECCGTPIFSNGLLDETRELAKKNIDVFLNYIEKGYKIVTTCPSCGLAIKDEYRDLVSGQKAEQTATNVWELFELLEEEEVLHFKEAPSKGEEAKIKAKIPKAFYHVPCHLRVQGMGYPGVSILRKYAVDNLILEDSYCCGLSGTYGFKKEKYELSKAIGSPLFEAIKASGAPLVITDCGTCKLQIEQVAGVPVKHTALVLREYLGYI